MKRRQILLAVILLITACKKPFNLPGNISDNTRYLVIEGVISSSDSTFIRLSRTKKVDTLKTIIPETGAHVSVESDANGSNALAEINAGTYAVAPLNLDASHKYRLRVKTADGKEYASDFVAVKNAPPIDTIGFVANAASMQIYVNAHDDANATRYYRWDFVEDWQFHSKYRSAYKTNGVDSIKPRGLDQQIYDCFGHDESTNVTIASTARLSKDVVYQQPITVVASNSEKIETKYCVSVKQYALTADAYNFWENLQKNTEKLGSIFDVLPSETASNFHCISNPAELVVGYLSVGDVAFKRVFITPGQLLASYNPQYPCYCEIDTAFFSPGPTQKSSVILLPANSPYIPLIALYPVPDLLGVPYAFTYSTILCVDCTIRGTKTRPPFWK
jgi:hypothetical protein